MFDDEADTISVDPSADLPTPSPSDTFKTVDAFESTRPIELKSDTIQNDQLLPVEEIEDTDILVVSKLIEEASVTNVDLGPPKRAATNADWPPAPKGPADRIHRRAGMYKAISSITKLNSLRRIGSSNS